MVVFVFFIQVGKTSKILAREWKNLTPDERRVWEKKSQDDKLRFEREMASYLSRVGNGKTPPKRPMTAYLAFSNERRAALKKQIPTASNAELSKMLSASWKAAPEEIRNKYKDQEKAQREQYNLDMIPWKRGSNVLKKPPPKASTDSISHVKKGSTVSKSSPSILHAALNLHRKPEADNKETMTRVAAPTAAEKIPSPPQPSVQLASKVITDAISQQQAILERHRLRQQLTLKELERQQQVAPPPSSQSLDIAAYLMASSAPPMDNNSNSIFPSLQRHSQRVHDSSCLLPTANINGYSTVGSHEQELQRLLLQQQQQLSDEEQIARVLVAQKQQQEQLLLRQQLVAIQQQQNVDALVARALGRNI